MLEGSSTDGLDQGGSGVPGGELGVLAGDEVLAGETRARHPRDVLQQEAGLLKERTHDVLHLLEALLRPIDLMRVDDTVTFHDRAHVDTTRHDTKENDVRRPSC